MSNSLDLDTESWIDQYLRGELSPEESRKFEDRLQSDSAFVKEVLLRKDIVVGIRAAEDRLLRQRLENIAQAAAQGAHAPVVLGKKSRPASMLILVGFLLAASLLAYLLYTFL